MLDTAIYNRFRNGGLIVAELGPSLQKHRRWLAIYQPKHEPIRDDVPDHIYSVLDFEIGEDMVNKRRYYAKTEEELFNLLRSLGVDLKRFTYPWKCDYPL